jgi:hypothetical protein
MPETSSSNTNPGQKLTPKPAKIITADKTFEIPPNASREQYNNIVKNCLDFIQANKLQDKPITVDGFKKEGIGALKQLINSNVPVNGLEDDKSNTLAKKDKEDIKLLNQAAKDLRKELNGKPISKEDFAKRLDAKFNQMKNPEPEVKVNLVDNDGNNRQLKFNKKDRRFDVDADTKMNQLSTRPKILAAQDLTSAPPSPAQQKQNAANPPTPKPSASRTEPKPEPTPTHKPTNWIGKAAEAQENAKPRTPSLYDLPKPPTSPLKVTPPGSN